MAFVLNSGVNLTGGLTTIVLSDFGDRTISSFPIDLELEYSVISLIQSNSSTPVTISSPNVHGSLQRLLTDNYITIDYNGDSVNDVSFLTLLTELSVHNGNIKIQSFDETLIDAFGNLKVSENYSIADYKSIFDKSSNLFDEVLTGGATSTFIANNSKINFILHCL